MNTCQSCLYYRAHLSRLVQTASHGEIRTVIPAACRRYPEELAREPGDWCGEFKEAKPKEVVNETRQTAQDSKRSRR